MPKAKPASSPCPSFRLASRARRATQFFSNSGRKLRRMTRVTKIQIAERGKECAVQFLWLLTDKTEPAPVIDLCFACIVTIGRMKPPIFSATKMRTRFFARFSSGRAHRQVNGGPCMPVAPAPTAHRLRS
jgi:hypothetical protein